MKIEYQGNFITWDVPEAQEVTKDFQQYGLGVLVPLESVLRILILPLYHILGFFQHSHKAVSDLWVTELNLSTVPKTKNHPGSTQSLKLWEVLAATNVFCLTLLYVILKQSQKHNKGFLF